jgi:alpha-glucosidase
MLELYRSALALRRRTAALGDGDLTWLDLPDGVLGFTRSPDFACVVNVSAAGPVRLPEGYDVLLATADVSAGLPEASAVWLHRTSPPSR